MEKKNAPILDYLKGKIVFLEYTTFKKGQHFMSVSWNEKGYHKVIARIYKAYDLENKKVKYYALDASGNQIYQDLTDLSSLKNKFKKDGKNLAMNTSPSRSEIVAKEQKEVRQNELEDLRSEKNNKSIDREI
jgi:hypothetical protein